MSFKQQSLYFSMFKCNSPLQPYFYPGGMLMIPSNESTPSSPSALLTLNQSVPTLPQVSIVTKMKNRSSLMEDFRNNLLPSLSLSDLSGHVVEFAQDQHGSRFIQQKLESASKVEKEKIFKVSENE